MRKREIFSIFLLISLFFNYGYFLSINYIRGENKIVTSSEYPGISHYEMVQNVTFEITINYTLGRLGVSSNTYSMQHSMFDNRIPSE